MTEKIRPAGSRRLTSRGAATRARIVESASELMFAQGVSATTLDEVMAASGTGKSQFYQHFSDKTDLVREVVAFRAGRVLERERGYLDRVDSLSALDRWRVAVVQRVTTRRGAYGCQLGSLASELADQDEDSRVALAQHFADWESLLAAALERMRAKQVLREDADPQNLATGIMAALQGGYLMAQVMRDAAPMRTALDMAFERVRSFAAKPRA
ncbi:MAG TPA: TetR family transcriptional regulator C-terminal domain-containing protein [Jatrophihabitantaceae bacterium]|nr:TetR family transcriptional regulator C-terminal domain-containing protein [Jatrophihabitantaceae bacterium]